MSSHTVKLWLVVSIALVALGCQRDDPPFQAQFSALGTIVDVTVAGTDAQRAEAAVREIETVMRAVETRWHAWHPSELTEINAQLARGETVALDPDATAYLKRAAALSTASGERFNPAIGRLIALWGFAGDAAPHGPPPTSEEIGALLAQQVSMRDLQFDERGITSRNPVLQLDLGGWAKTIALDEAVALLQSRGMTNALVNIGGDLRLLGDKAGAPWRIGIRHPRENGVLAAIEGRGDESVFTSGDYERYFEWEGKRYQHIIDPHTGYPAQGVAAVTVVHGESAVAEAASKALLIAGVAGWREVAARMGITQAMLITTDLEIFVTRSFAQRVQFLREPSRLVVVD